MMEWVGQPDQRRLTDSEKAQRVGKERKNVDLCKGLNAPVLFSHKYTKEVFSLQAV